MPTGVGGHWSPDSCACRRPARGWSSVECVPSSPSAPRASCDTMQDSGRAPGAPSGYSRCALRPRRRPSTEHSPESQKQPASSQSGFIAACPPALLPLNHLSLSPLCQGGAGGNVGSLLLRKKGQGPRSDHINPRRKEGRQARHGRLWLFGSGRRLAPIWTTASQSATPEGERLATSAKTSTRPAEGGAREERSSGGFDRVVRAGGLAGWRWHPSRQVLPSRQRGSRTSKYSRSGISERSACHPRAIVATRDWLILTESLDVSRPRAESSPCPRRKGGTQSSTCWTPHESQSRHRCV